MRIAALAAALVLCACASPAPAPTPARSSLPLLSPSTLGTSRSVQQVLRATYADQEYVLSAVLQVTPQRLRVIGLNAVGLRVFTLEYDGLQVRAEVIPGLPDQIEPTRILADLQLAMWPLAALRAATVGSPWEVSESLEGVRTIKRSGTPIAEVRYPDRSPWNGRVELTNHEFKYSLIVDSKPLE